MVLFASAAATAAAGERERGSRRCSLQGPPLSKMNVFGDKGSSLPPQ